MRIVRSNRVARVAALAPALNGLLFVTAGMFFAPSTAHAIIWNNDSTRGVVSTNGLTDKPAGSPFLNSFVVNNGFNSTRGTGTYLGNGWMITARHVVQGTSYGNIAPPATITFNGYTAAQIFVAPSSAEIALVKLEGVPTGMPGLAISQIYTAGAESGKIAAMGGYGYWGPIGTTENTAANFHRAYNVVSTSGGFIDSQLNTQTRLADQGLLQGGAMPGDSGSGLFVLDSADANASDWSQYKLAGILATSQGNYWGADSSFVRISSFGSFVTNTVYTGRTYKWARGIAGTFSWNNSTLNGDGTNGNNWNSSLTPTVPMGAGDTANAGANAGANNQTINLDANTTIGALTLGSTNNGTGNTTIAAGGAFALTFDNVAQPAWITHNPSGKADIISSPIVVAGVGSLTLTNSSSTALTISGPIRSGLGSGTQTLVNSIGANTVTGVISDGAMGGAMAVRIDAGTLTLTANNSYRGGTTLNAGTLNLNVTGAAGTGYLTANAGTVKLGTDANSALVVGDLLTVAGGATPAAKIDIAGSALVLSKTAGNTEPILTSLIKNGRAAGLWTGNGIDSSVAASNATRFAVGLVDNASVGMTTFHGQTVSSDSLLIAYTRLGDATLDGQVNFDDLLALAQNYGISDRDTWSRGDFNYDGSTNFDDLLALAQNYGSSSSLDADWALAQSLVPEPMMLAPAASFLLSRRRRC